MRLPMIQLSTKDREEIDRWLMAHGTPQQVAMRSRIVLAAAAGRSDGVVARELEINRKTVILWRTRFAHEGIDSLWEVAAGRGRKPVFGPDKIQAIVNATLQTKPKGITQWSCRLMAEHQKVSKSTVSNIWRSHNLKPHRVKSFKLSRDARFLEKLTDVVGLYLNPPQQALVLCVDEKSQIQALDRTQPGLPLKKGRCGTMTHDYKRNGTTTLFAALEVLQGKVVGQCYKRHRHQEFLKFLRRLDEEFPGQTPLHLVMDKLWHAPASQRASLAQTTSTFHPAFCADKFQLVESGGTVVRRTDFQTSPPRIVQQRGRVRKGDPRVSGCLE